MNSGTGNLIGSVSYELASDEACQTKAQHEAGPSPSKPSATTTRQACDQAQRKSQAQPKLGRARGAATSGLALCVGRKACVRC